MIQIRVDTRVNLVEGVRFVWSSRVWRWAGSGGRGTSQTSSVSSVSASVSASRGRTGQTSVVSAGVGAGVGAGVSSGVGTGVEAANGRAAASSTSRAAASVQIGVNTGISLVGQVGIMGASIGGGSVRAQARGAVSGSVGASQASAGSVGAVGAQAGAGGVGAVGSGDASAAVGAGSPVISVTVDARVKLTLLACDLNESGDWSLPCLPHSSHEDRGWLTCYEIQSGQCRWCGCRESQRHPCYRGSQSGQCR
jgi:hypothetical protein